MARPTYELMLLPPHRDRLYSFPQVQREPQPAALCHDEPKTLLKPAQALAHRVLPYPHHSSGAAMVVFEVKLPDMALGACLSSARPTEFVLNLDVTADLDMEPES
jgi:hypothetical protein